MFPVFILSLFFWIMPLFGEETKQKPVLFYTFHGITMGHTGRALELTQALQEKYDLHLFTYEEGYKLFLEKGWPKEKLHRIKNRVFSEDNQSNPYQMSYILQFYLQLLDQEVERVYKKFQHLCPVAILSDSEPLGSRLSACFKSKNKKVPFMSLDSQHEFFHKIHENIGIFKKTALWFYMANEKCVTPWYDFHMVQTFHPVPFPFYIPPFISQEIRDLSIKKENKILVYLNANLKKEDQLKIFSFLSKTKETCVIYTPNDMVSQENLIYKKPSRKEFLQDLASCKAVLTTAGVALVGEAQFLKKPMFVIPVPWDPEQYSNMLHVQSLDIGSGCPLDELTPKMFQSFLDRVDEDSFVKRELPNGLPLAMKKIETFLQEYHQEVYPFTKTIAKMRQENLSSEQTKSKKPLSA